MTDAAEENLDLDVMWPGIAPLKLEWPQRLCRALAGIAECLGHVNSLEVSCRQSRGLGQVDPARPLLTSLQS